MSNLGAYWSIITGNRQRTYSGPSPTAGTSERTVRLADVVQEVLEDRILPQQSRFSSVMDAWQDLVPAELKQHSRVVDLVAGVLKVMVDSPAYVYELQLCRSALLNELQQQCPQAGIKGIQLAVG